MSTAFATRPSPPARSRRRTIPGTRRKRRLTHLRKVQLLAILCGLPSTCAALILLLAGDYGFKAYATFFVIAGGVWLYFIIRLQIAITRPLQTASNMLSALREGDFSLQASYVDASDPLGQVMLEINMLTEVLSEHRMGAIEALALLDKVVDEIDAAVFTFDPERRLTLANRVGRALLGDEDRNYRGRYAGELNLDRALDAAGNATIDSPGEAAGLRFSVRRGSFREGGEPHQLLILIDVSRTLREEELNAWKRLIRVLGHEINNSMAPISSLAHSLKKMTGHLSLEDEDREDLTDGLEVIRGRAESLTRFVSDYARLAKLPSPAFRPVDLRHTIDRVCSLTSCEHLEVDESAPAVSLVADPDQLEQVLINLLKNATEAAQESAEKPLVRLNWTLPDSKQLEITIEDNGAGIANPSNLFVPFFSTKKGGSGIGLTLCRQIVEAHHGSIRLENRTDTSGCRATVTLPLEQPA